MIKKLILQYGITDKANMQNPDPQSAPTHALGRIMALCAWILGILLLALFFNQWNKTSQKPRIQNVDGVQETIIERNLQNQYLVDGWIDGVAVTFLLDTGANHVVVPEKLAKRLKLKQGNKQMASTAGGKVIIYETRIQEIKFGHIVLKDIRASISPDLPDDEVLLGMTALRRINFLQKGDQLILTNP